MGPRFTYAVADLHGRFDLLEQAIAAIDAHAQAQDHTVVFLGDYVDRGPASCQIIERLRDGPAVGSIWICLKGNHEDMMLQASSDPSLMPWWLGNGGDHTLASYRASGIAVGDHLGWIKHLPRLHSDRHRVFVHAGVDPGLPLHAQNEKMLMWKRYPSSFAGGHGDHHVVHGHHPYEDGPRRFTGRTALDTLAWRTGRLVVAVFDDAVAGGPIDLLEVGRPLSPADI
jgi:serine/threonine protein phosphatase 1